MGKLEKYISHVLGLKTAKIKGEFSSYQNITLVQKQTKLENICPKILIWEVFTFHLTWDCLLVDNLKWKQTNFRTRVLQGDNNFDFTVISRSDFFPCAQ